MGVGSAVNEKNEKTNSGGVVMVAMVDNAGGICKSFLKLFINSIFVVQTNLRWHTLQTHSSHIENLRSV